MDFTLSDEHQMLRDTVSDLLSAHCTGGQLRKMLDAGIGHDRHRWQLLSDMGIAGMLAPERLGGGALDETALVVVAEACGYAALPEPLIDHAAVAVPILAASSDAWARRAIGGDLIGIGHPGNPFVLDADNAAALLLAQDDEIHLVPIDAVRLTFKPGFDPFRRLFAVEWQASPATRIADGQTGGALWADARDRGALAAAAQLVGLAQRAVDIAVAYARERHQFGKPIGAAQAVKHLLADAQVKIEFARPVVQAAAAALAGHNPIAGTRVAHAKLAAADAADRATHAALQVHGAMGYSWDVDVHFLLKRALALTNSWGTLADHRRTVAAHVLDADLGPDCTFGSAWRQQHEPA